MVVSTILERNPELNHRSNIDLDNASIVVHVVVVIVVVVVGTYDIIQYSRKFLVDKIIDVEIFVH